MKRVRWVMTAVAAAAGCGGAQSGEAPAEPRVEVETALIEQTSLPQEYQLTGHLRPVPGGSALLAAPAAGVIKAVHGQTGTAVTAGTAVVELDTPELDATADQMAAAANLAEREAARTDSLFRDGIVARKEVDRAQAAVIAARSGATAAGTLAARAVVRSPLGGIVQRIVVQRGERVDAGQLLAEIVNPLTLDLVATAPADVLAHLRRGQPALVIAGGDEVAATLEAVAPGVDAATGVGEALIRVKNRDRRLRPGQSATAIVTTGTARLTLVVPVDAVVLVGAAATVFVISRDSVAHARTVILGIRSAGRVEVRGDLAAGDRVVTRGAYGLADGGLVAPTAAKPQ